MTKTKLVRVLLITVIGLAIASLISLYQIKSEQGPSNVVVENFGGPFTLKNQKGETVTQENFENTYRLIYFGFTYCPAICPTELQKISSALKELGGKGQQIQPIFITVDPERDTVETMKNYVTLFHPRLIGLTGTKAQIEEAKKSYKIYSAKVQDETMNDYTVDHSSFIYFIDANNSLLRIFKTDDTAEDIVKTVNQYL